MPVPSPKLHIQVPAEQARAALWVIENNKFSGRKHPGCKAFVETVRAAGIDLNGKANHG